MRDSDIAVFNWKFAYSLNVCFNKQVAQEGFILTKKIKLIIGVVCLSLISVEVWAAAGWTSYGEVTELNPTTDGRFIVNLDVASNPSECKHKQSFYCNYDGAGYDQIFLALLGALTSRKKVRVYVTGYCDINGYSEISSASVIP